MPLKISVPTSVNEMAMLPDASLMSPASVNCVPGAVANAALLFKVMAA